MVINEIAWAGTASSSSDEWIELYNAGDSDVDLTGWAILAEDETPTITLTGIIASGEYYLLERTDDDTVKDISFDEKYTGALGNGGEVLVLIDAEGVERDRVGTADAPWYGGDNETKATMERIDPLASGTDPDNWATWGSTGNETRVGSDAGGNPINGTPRFQNSASSL